MRRRGTNPKVKKYKWVLGNKRCWYCLRKVRFNESVAEHIVPISRGGNNGAWNMAIACKKCDIKKSNRTPLEVLAGWPALTKGKMKWF